MFDFPNFAHFVAGCCIAGSGVIVLAVLMHSVSGDRRYPSNMGAELGDNGSRFIAGAYTLVAFWIGVRLVKTTGEPAHWADAAEMGWVFLGATAVSSAAFILRSALPKWTLGLSVIGLCAMVYVSWSP